MRLIIWLILILITACKKEIIRTGDVADVKGKLEIYPILEKTPVLNIELSDTLGHQYYTLNTNDYRFSFLDIPPGTYTITASNSTYSGSAAPFNVYPGVAYYIVIRCEEKK